MQSFETSHSQEHERTVTQKRPRKRVHRKCSFLEELHVCSPQFYFKKLFTTITLIYATGSIFHLPAGNYMSKVSNRNSRTRSEICSKLTIKIPQRRHWRRSSIFIVNFEHISHLALVFLLLTLIGKCRLGL